MFPSKRIASTATLYAWVSLANALPSGSFMTLRDGNSSDPPDYSICDYTFNSDDERADLWTNTGAGQWLDDFITKYGEENWVQRVDEETLADGTSIWDCTGEDTFCGPPQPCSDFVDAGVGPAYWVLVAAGKARDSLAYLHERWQDTGLIDALQIDSIVDDFQEPDSFNVLAALTASMSVSAAVLGPLGPEAAIASSAFTITGAGFGYALATKSDEVDPEADIQDQFGDAWAATEDALQETMNVAFTGGQDGYPSTSLPNLDTTYANPIANWFAGGRWLVSSVSDTMDPVAEEMEIRSRQAIVDEALNAIEVMVVIDTAIESSDDCGARSGATIWLEGIAASADDPDGPTVDQCALLEYMINSDSIMGSTLDTDYTDKMINDYSIDLAEVYYESLRCALSGDGTIEGSLDTLTDEPALCFWNFPVVRGDQGGSDLGGAGTGWGDVCDFDVNTTGRSEASAC